jgi:hypothetical protein
MVKWPFDLVSNQVRERGNYSLRNSTFFTPSVFYSHDSSPTSVETEEFSVELYAKRCNKVTIYYKVKFQARLSLSPGR